MQTHILIKSIFVFIVLNIFLAEPVYIYAQNDSKASDTLYVKSAVLAKNVVEREPISIVQSYELSDDEAWCFTRIHNTKGLLNIHFKWYHEDGLYTQMKTKIGESESWRTYSNVELKEGSWRVEIVGPEGKVLKEIRFNVSD